MKKPHGHIWTALRCLQWISAVLAVLIAIFVMSNSWKLRAAVTEQLRERNRLKLRAAKAELEHYANEIRICLELIAKFPQVMEVSPESEAYLQAVYDANFDQHQVQEIYVLESGFDGQGRPLRSFERGSVGRRAEELHTLGREAEEYAVQKGQIRRFESEPDVDFLISKPVELCVGERGFVFSVPVRFGGELQGVVAGMVPTSVLSQVLEESSIVGNQLLLLRDGHGLLTCCPDFPSESIGWSEVRLRSVDKPTDTVDGEAGFVVGAYHVHTTRVDLLDGGFWQVASFYNEVEGLAESGVGGRFIGPLTCVIVLLLGGAVVALCGVVPALHSARTQADERTRALGDREGRLRSVLNTAPDGIITIGEDGVIESFNAAAERLFGYSSDEIIGEDASILAPEPFAARHREGLARYLATGKSVIIGMGCDVVGRRKDGSTFPMHLTVSEVRLPDRRVFTGIGRDVTELERAGETIRRHNEILENTVEERTAELASAKERAEEHNRAKSVFLANMSHELRTPLHSILSFAGFGVKRYQSAGRQKMAEYFQMIEQSGQTLLALLNDLLDLSKLESGEIAFDLRPVDVHTLARSVVAEFGALASERGVKLEVQDRDQEVVVPIDMVKIEQVFRNLLSNAVKFSPKGGLVQVAITRGNGAVVVSVCDEGPGIPDGELESVFDKFVQSSKTQTGAGGTGLGLAICRQIVTGHHGRIWVENRAEGGARVLCELPLHATVGPVAAKATVEP